MSKTSEFNKHEIGVFYDNSKWNLKDCDKINGLISILIYETDEDNITTSDWNNNRTHYLKIIKNQEQYPYILDILDQNPYLKEDMVDHLSGINNKQIDNLIKLIYSDEMHVKFVVLDFDRTITKIEGILDAKDLLRHIPPEVVAKYYFGGTDRLEKLHLLFDILEKFKIDLYILTNNDALDYIYKLLNIAGLIREPLKYIFFNNETVDSYPHKIKTIIKKIGSIKKYKNVFNNNNNISSEKKIKIKNFLETEDNCENGDSKYK